MVRDNALLSGVLSVGHTLAHDAHVLFLGLGWVLLPLWGKIQKLGKLRLVGMILISAGLGTMAVLVGSVVVAVILRNYLGVVIGTWHILADLYWLVCDDI